MRIFATDDDFIEDDKTALYASFGDGNTRSHLEVQLEGISPGSDGWFTGWFKVSDLQAIVNAAIEDAGKARP